MRSVLEERRPVVDEAIESLLPRTVDDAYLTELFGEATYEYDPTAIQEALADPIWDLLDRGGKRWRAVLGVEWPRVETHWFQGTLAAD